jgi:hypothetical protein
MSRRPQLRAIAVACLVPLALAACGNATELLNTASVPPLPSLPSLPQSIAVTPHTSSHSESTHEIYARVARGAKTCWFGPGKPLVKNYAFDGEAASEADGGAAEVSVHVRAPEQPNARGGKVFVVKITKEADGSKLEMENRRIPETMAEQMRADVAKWAKTGSIECGVVTVPGTEVAASVPLPERKPAMKATPTKRKKK